MLIELKDRKYWLKKVDAVLSHIVDVRKERDAKHEAVFETWQKKQLNRSCFAQFLYGRVPEAITSWWVWENMNEFYPSEYAHGDLKLLRNVRRALVSEKTGTITLDGEELRAIG